MTAGAQVTGLAHACEFIGGFHRPVVIEFTQQIWRIQRRGVRAGCCCLRTDKGHATETFPVRGGLRVIVHGDQIDLRRPGCLRQPRGFVPEVVGLIEQDCRARARPVHHDAARIVHNRYPSLEVGINLVGVVLVVQELDGRPPGVHHQRIKAGGRQRAVGTLHKRRQMGRI